ncbi:MAG TPA: hypothetical protein VFS40_14965, partial [Gemmatimonadales bacterium]|nr:hypothetical protein [Gemmatimonadales bacterium]
MKRLSTAALATLAAFGLAACSSSEGPTAPSMAAAAKSTAAIPTTADASVAGQYMVLFRGNAIPADFEAQVKGAGGKVIYANGNAGFAFVSGLPAETATKIGGMSSVAEVRQDAALELNTPRAAVEADLTDIGTSQANPATAGRYNFQWNMRLIGADKAWAAGKLGSPDVTVAILDTGIDYDAPDLNGLV